VLKGRAIVDGLTLSPLDVILGPGNEPHGPIDYPGGCKLFSAFVGSYYHSAVDALATEKHYRLIQSAQIDWQPSGPDGAQAKTLVDRGCKRLLLKALRFRAGSALAANDGQMLAALLVDGEMRIDDDAMGAWDFIYLPRGRRRAPLRFAQQTTLLAVSLQ
jgi:hypothetical protein